MNFSSETLWKARKISSFSSFWISVLVPWQQVILILFAISHFLCLLSKKGLFGNFLVRLLNFGELLVLSQDQPNFFVSLHRFRDVLLPFTPLFHSKKTSYFISLVWHVREFLLATFKKTLLDMVKIHAAADFTVAYFGSAHSSHFLEPPTGCPNG